ncbi:alpha-L-fucosidase [Haloferula sp.]|uniref:alpha-L-fucosidase n=1 Tax=Haloferula sp. TaxID=2497595 RepID=UPI003C7293F4
MEERRQEFLSWKFGMFIHFNMATFYEREWANGYEDPESFSPDLLDCNQWTVAAQAAGMKYAVFTTKHTGGWCLWDSQHTASHDISAFTKFKDEEADLVKEFLSAFRACGIKVGLYYCFPGDYAGRNGAPKPPAGNPDLKGLPPEAQDDYVGFMKLQLEELLTQYGKIDLLWIDQFNNEYTVARWPEIFKHLKSLQPDCIVIANNSRNFSQTDIHSFEYPFLSEHKPEQSLPPVDNSYPSEVCDKMGPEWNGT